MSATTDSADHSFQTKSSKAQYVLREVYRRSDDHVPGISFPEVLEFLRSCRLTEPDKAYGGGRWERADSYLALGRLA